MSVDRDLLFVYAQANRGVRVKRLSCLPFINSDAVWVVKKTRAIYFLSSKNKKKSQIKKKKLEKNLKNYTFNRLIKCAYIFRVEQIFHFFCVWRKLTHNDCRLNHFSCFFLVSYWIFTIPSCLIYNSFARLNFKKSLNSILREI